MCLLEVRPAKGWRTLFWPRIQRDRPGAFGAGEVGKEGRSNGCVCGGARGGAALSRVPGPARRRKGTFLAGACSSGSGGGRRFRALRRLPRRRWPVHGRRGERPVSAYAGAWWDAPPDPVRGGWHAGRLVSRRAFLRGSGSDRGADIPFTLQRLSTFDYFITSC